MVRKRYEPPTPGVAESPSRVPADRTGKVAVIITAFVLVAGAVGLGAVVMSGRNSVPIKIESVVESVDSTNGCEWRLAIELLNNTDQPLFVDRIGAILNRGRRGSTIQQAPRIAAGETGTYLVAFRLPAGDVCPAVDEINHGNLIFSLEDGSSESLRF